MTKKRMTAVLVWLIFSSTISFSDENEHEGSRSNIPTAMNQKWKMECASCHMLYLPGLLPARSWEKMMGGLNKHFGENAELDPATKKEITEFLVKNSSDHSKSRRGDKILKSINNSDTPLKISETLYFKRKHDELSANIFKRKAIRSAGNCIACHKGAEAGNFSEDQVHIPKEGEVLKKK